MNLPNENTVRGLVRWFSYSPIKIGKGNFFVEGNFLWKAIL